MKPSTTKTRKLSRAPSPPLQAPVVSHPQKILWPDSGITKQDLVSYYEAAAERLLIHLARRPVSIIRAPDGIAHQTFFQRHAGAGMSALLDTVKADASGKPYLVVTRPEALMALAQMAAVELHPWGVTIDDLERPDQVTFDLDPGPDVVFAAVATAARELNERLDSLGLAGFAKSTGGKGLHVVVPLTRAASWEQVKEFAYAVSKAMADDAPDRFTVNMAKRQRRGRIFIDYLRNQRGASAIAPWSPRARAGAPVAVPLDWKEVTARLGPAKWSLRDAGILLKRSATWPDFDRARRKLTPAWRR